MTKKVFSFIAICLFHLNNQAQVIRCSTTENEALRRANSPVESIEDFESWLQIKIAEFKKSASYKTSGSRAVATIPIIVHVIHNGDAVGTNENISQAQVLSQIDVLNEDYRRAAGTLGFNTNPVGADVELNFCPALVDPNGQVLAEPGIDRVNLGQTSWTEVLCNSTVKPQTSWDPTRYCNIWTVLFGGSSASTLGFAQFPSSTLAGLGTNPGATNTDGVVINYKEFGRVGNLDATYNKGRTLSHELGHWLGLRHIWGDASNCSGTDYCDDTPNSAAANYGCPSQNTCTDPSPDPNDMVQNYMDYTDDACMNIFTNDQKIRIQTVINNAPRRLSLLTSDVCTIPITFNYSGTITNAANALGIANAKVKLTGPATYNLTCDAAGKFAIQNMKMGTYTIYAGQWGFITKMASNIVIDSLSAPYSMSLTKGYYDDFVFDFGWTEAGTATSGRWTRGVPVATTNNGATCNPGADVTNDLGDMAYVTGNAGGNAGTDDIDNGNTVLTSPVMDLTTYTNPKISYARWFYDAGGNGTPNDSLIISISNGTNTVTLDSIGNQPADFSQWIAKSVNVSSKIAITNNMRLIIKSFDLSPGNIVEAGFDYFQVLEDVVGEIKNTENELNVQIFPNPSQGIFEVIFPSKSFAGGQLQVLDNVGRRVLDVPVEAGSTAKTINLKEAESGIYFLKIVSSEGISEIHKLLKK